jgi:lipoprotein-anchoring transpeptidase ErfK/SrfK
VKSEISRWHVGPLGELGVTGAKILAVGALLLAALASGCAGSKSNDASRSNASASTQPRATTTTTTKAEAEARLLSEVTVSPANGATDQSLASVVTVRASGARLESVKVATSGGAALAGSLDAAGDAWRSTGSLLPTTTYKFDYEVTGTDGISATGSGKFTTAAPAEPVTAAVFPSPGIAVGVGQPIVFTFSQPIETYAAQQAVLSHLHIAMSQPVPGGWHWFSSDELHFRPSSFWPVGEQVQVTGNLNYWDIGGGAWGVGSVSTAFVVEDSHISTVNLTTHEMTVTDNGQTVYQWPISAGAEEWPTQDGEHIVLDRESDVHMVSSTVNIPVHSPHGYDEHVYWDVHISDSGEYVHAAPWSVTEQGIVNVSHGCVNLSPARAYTFFRFSRVGDVVDIIDGTRPPLTGDHGVMDWSFGSSTVSWTPAKVSALTTTVTTFPTTTVVPPAKAPWFPTTLPPMPTTTTVATAPTATTATTVPAATVPAATVPVATVPVATVPTASTAVPVATVPTSATSQSSSSVGATTAST